MHSTTRRASLGRRTLMGLAAALAAAVVLPAAPLWSAPAPSSSLYARLGGYDFIAGLVDTAFPRVAAHPQLRRFFQGHARDSQIRQRQLIVDALCQATGGPCVYTGRPMKGVHAGLGITPSDWSVFAGILSGALEELGSPAKERKEFLDLLESRFRPHVLEDR